MGNKESSQRIAPHPAIGRLVEQCVLPQMVDSHRQLGLRSPYARPAFCPPVLSPEAVERYLATLLKNHTEDSLREAEDLLCEGLSFRELCLGLLAPAARLLGERWVDDTLSFSEVTLASWQLESVLRQLGSRFEPTQARRTMRGTLLVALLPGAQHTFGARMLLSFFRQSGWDAQLLQARDPGHMLQVLRSRQLDVLALSLSQREDLVELAPLVEAARAASLKPGLQILLGGRAVSENPGLAQASGATVCTGEADQAVALAAHPAN